MDNWISVDDRVPELINTNGSVSSSEQVITKDEYNDVEIDQYYKIKDDIHRWTSGNNVKLWMFIPPTE